MLTAMTHQISPYFQDCELTTLERQPINLETARSQHHQYCSILSDLGLEIIELAVNIEFPDSTFIEDTAVVLDDLAVMSNMGAESRKGEVKGIAAELSKYRRLAFIDSPGTLEGGDVLCIGKHIYTGLTTRTNQTGIDRLRELVTPFKYEVHEIPLTGCLHLKSAVTALSDKILLINPDWVDPGNFPDFELIFVPEKEPESANILRVKDTVIVHEGHRHTIEKLTRSGFRIQPTNISELMKAEAGLTCSSLIFSRA